MRITGAISVTVSAAIAAGDLVASLAYIGHPRTSAAFWLATAAAMVGGATYTGACARDQAIAAHVEHDQAVMRRLDDLALMISDYGDQRETAGHVTALRVTHHQRRLSPID